MPTITYNQSSYECDHDADECPMCYRSIDPIFLESYYIDQIGVRPPRIEVVYQCPSGDCRSIFFARYVREVMGPRPGKYKYAGSAPRGPKSPQIYKGIRELSPNFVEIYTQSNEAEIRGWMQVAGVGLRKSLEFLIKDFCCSVKPDDAEAIKGCRLGKCIETYIDDQYIKECARWATWLGNDETHYVRTWVDKDINDLKALLGLTMSWIETSLKTAAWRASMEPRKEKPAE